MYNYFLLSLWDKLNVVTKGYFKQESFIKWYNNTTAWVSERQISIFDSESFQATDLTCLFTEKIGS